MCTSENKVCRKDLLVGEESLEVLERKWARPEGGGGVTIGIRAGPHDFTGAWGRSCTGMVQMAGVGPEWSHSMAHALALGTQTCQEAMFLAWGCPTGMSGIRADPRGFTGATGHSYTRLPDRDVSLLGGVSVTSWPRVNRILIPTSCTFFS